MCFSIGVVVVHRYSKIHPRTVREISSFLTSSSALLKIFLWRRASHSPTQEVWECSKVRNSLWT